jgi:hypothetical protein
MVRDVLTRTVAAEVAAGAVVVADLVRETIVAPGASLIARAGTPEEKMLRVLRKKTSQLLKEKSRRSPS